MSLVPLPSDLPSFLGPYLPQDKSGRKPFVTLTYAQSLDSRISKGHGIRTIISHEETKTMTHYLRYHHDGILVGTGTVLADNPGLNCKWSPNNDHINNDDNCESRTTPSLMVHSPRPIIVDMKQNWRFVRSKMWDLYKSEQGKSPIVVIYGAPKHPEPDVLYMIMDSPTFEWDELVLRLKEEYGIQSLMVEGGAQVINTLLLRPDLVDSLIITIGPTYLGSNGVEVSPKKPLNLENVNWWRGTNDTVMCATLSKE